MTSSQIRQAHAANANTTSAKTFASECFIASDWVGALGNACESVTKVAAFVSAAEAAIRHASGQQVPVTCFGCDSPEHLWCDFPHKMTQLLARRRTTSWTPSLGHSRRTRLLAIAMREWHCKPWQNSFHHSRKTWSFRNKQSETQRDRGSDQRESQCQSRQQPE